MIPYWIGAATATSAVLLALTARTPTSAISAGPELSLLRRKSGHPKIAFVLSACMSVKTIPATSQSLKTSWLPSVHFQESKGDE